MKSKIFICKGLLVNQKIDRMNRRFLRLQQIYHYRKMLLIKKQYYSRISKMMHVSEEDISNAAQYTSNNSKYVEQSTSNNEQHGCNLQFGEYTVIRKSDKWLNTGLCASKRLH